MSRTPHRPHRGHARHAPHAAHHHPAHAHGPGAGSATALTVLGLLVAAGMVGGAVAFVVLGARSTTTTVAPTPLAAVSTTTPTNPTAAATATPAPTPKASTRPAQATRPAAAAAPPITLVGAPLLVPAGRSAIPQPGEDLDEPLPARRLADEPAASAAPAEDTPAEGDIPVVPWSEANRHVGKVITAEGKIVRAHNTGKVCFLNFVDQQPSDAFYLIIFEDLLDHWPQPPQDHFMNQTVRATGRVYQHRGKPQIRIEKADQLTIVE